MTYKSTVTKNKELKYDEIIRIGKLQAPKPFVDQETQRITKMHQHDLQSGKMNNGQVQQMVQNSIIQRNIIEATKEYLKSFVTVTFNDEDINAAIAELKIKQPQIPETAHKQIAERVVYENLIFAFLVKE
jgi:flagellar biosynthesis protein FliP